MKRAYSDSSCPPVQEGPVVLYALLQWTSSCEDVKSVILLERSRAQNAWATQCIHMQQHIALSSHTQVVG
jgi:hypothetical protein